MNSTTRKASFYTLGCRLNQAETALIANRFRSGGYEIVDFGESADVCVINSCTVTEQADAKCRQVVRKILRRHPRTFVAVVGCYAQTDAAALQKIDGLDLIVGMNDKLNVLEFIDSLQKLDTPRIVRRKMTRDAFTINSRVPQLLTTRANLKIQDGCDFMCSFCVIPFARGRARSRAFQDIQREAIDLARAGYKELVLTGVNIGTYANEKKNFLDVVKMLLRIPALERLRISSIEPTTIPEALLDLIAESDRLCSHLHVPLQSGSDAVLARMRRHYTRSDFLRFLERADKKVPDILIGTDLMVGFPGETSAEFAESCAVLQDSPLAYAHVFSFSARPGTAAARLSDKVPAQAIKERSRMLHELSERKKRLFYQQFIGRDLRVLTETQSPDGVWLGFSDNYLKVAIPDRGQQSNALLKVKIRAIDRGIAIAA